MRNRNATELGEQVVGNEAMPRGDFRSMHSK
jgi:hypothetical protein